MLHFTRKQIKWKIFDYDPSQRFNKVFNIFVYFNGRIIYTFEVELKKKFQYLFVTRSFLMIHHMREINKSIVYCYISKK